MNTGNCLAAFLVLFILLTGAAGPAYGAGTTETFWGREFSRSNYDDSIYYLDHVTPQEKVEIAVVKEILPDIAEQMIAEKIFLFGSLFERQRVGYPGQHTEFIDCPPEFKPVYVEKDVEGSILRYFSGFASERFAFGACDEESASYPAVNAYLYCRDREVMYDINYFSLDGSKAATQAFVDAIGCER